MYRIGQRELDGIAGVFATGNLFRYLAEGGAECERFETRYAERLGVRALPDDGQRHQCADRGADGGGRRSG